MVHRRERRPEVDHHPAAVDLGQRDRSDHAVDEQRLPVQPDDLDTMDRVARFHGRVQKVSVSMPEDLATAIRERTGPGGFSRYVTEAVERRFSHDRLGDLLDELEAEYGPVSPELLEWAQRQWPDHDE